MASVAGKDALERDPGAVVVGGHCVSRQPGQRHRDSFSVRGHHVDRGLGGRIGGAGRQQSQAKDKPLHNLT